MSDLGRRFAEEIADLHRFFEAWFNGVGERRIEEFSHRLDSGFVIVSPQGHHADKEEIVNAVLARAGSYQVKITTSDAALHVSTPVMIGTYREHHEFRGEVTRRIASVAMVVDATAATGYRWLSVHETWIGDES